MKSKLILYLFTLLIFACGQNQKEKLIPLEKLKIGNQRFANGKPIHPDETLDRLRELEKSQNPFSVIISCSDSRVPPELIFDQGFGDIFSIRTAGNIIGDYEIGSVEYAIEHLDCHLIVVLGHSNCGALQTFVETNGEYPNADHIKSIIEYLKNEKEEQALLEHKPIDIDSAVYANVRHGVSLLKHSDPFISHFYNSGKTQIVGAVYNIHSHIVDFIE